MNPFTEQSPTDGMGNAMARLKPSNWFRRRRGSAPIWEDNIHENCQGTEEDLARLKSAIERNPRLIDGKGDRWPLLLHAVVRKHPACIQMLLQNGAQVNEIYEPLQKSALMLSCEGRCVHQTRVLLQHDSSGINNPHPCSLNTPLAYAVLNNKLELAKLLIEFGANVDGVILTDYLAIISYAQVSVEVCDYRGSQMMRILLYAGAHLKIQEEQFFAIQSAFSKALATGSVENLQPLVAYGVLRDLFNYVPPANYPEIGGLALYMHTVVHPLMSIRHSLAECERYIPQVLCKILELLRQGGLATWENIHARHVLAANELGRIFPLEGQNPLSLKSLCRLKLQSVMGSNYLRNVPHLELPATLIPFLRFEEL